MGVDITIIQFLNYERGSTVNLTWYKETLNNRPTIARYSFFTSEHGTLSGADHMLAIKQVQIIHLHLKKI